MKVVFLLLAVVLLYVLVAYGMSAAVLILPGLGILMLILWPFVAIVKHEEDKGVFYKHGARKAKAEVMGEIPAIVRVRPEAIPRAVSATPKPSAAENDVAFDAAIAADIRPLR